MKNIVHIDEAYIPNKKSMILIHKGVLSLDSAAAINSFREAAQAEEKELNKSRKLIVSKTCKRS